VIAIDAGIVGPPLLETLRMLAGTCRRRGDRCARGRVQGELRQQRLPPDRGLRRRRRDAAPPGAAGCTLSIATNKRLLPTRLILEHLGWSEHFAAVYALDLFEPRLPDKAAMIARLLQDRGIARADAVYVGDRGEDGESADANRLPFIAATWGYGSLRRNRDGAALARGGDPAALADEILGEA
jgi:phosphoglycolate phosphatase